MKRPSQKPNTVKQDVPNQQSQKFIETASELGCDEDEAAFDGELRRIAKSRLHNDKKDKDSQK